MCTQYYQDLYVYREKRNKSSRKSLYHCIDREQLVHPLQGSSIPAVNYHRGTGPQISPVWRSTLNHIITLDHEPGQVNSAIERSV